MKILVIKELERTLEALTKLWHDMQDEHLVIQQKASDYSDIQNYEDMVFSAGRCEGALQAKEAVYEQLQQLKRGTL